MKSKPTVIEKGGMKPNTKEEKMKKQLKEELEILLNPKIHMPKMYSFDEVRVLIEFARAEFHEQGWQSGYKQAGEDKLNTFSGED